MSDDTKIVVRIYEKLSSVFAQIGGLAHSIILIGKFILYFWSDNNILIHLISKIIPQKEENDFFIQNKKINIEDISRLNKSKTFVPPKDAIIKNIKRQMNIDNSENINGINNQPLSMFENKVNSSLDYFIKKKENEKNNHSEEIQRREEAIHRVNEEIPNIINVVEIQRRENENENKQRVYHRIEEENKKEE